VDGRRRRGSLGPPAGAAAARCQRVLATARVRGGRCRERVDWRRGELDRLLLLAVAPGGQGTAGPTRLRTGQRGEVRRARGDMGTLRRLRGQLKRRMHGGGGADVDDAARRVSHRMAPACRPSSLGATHDPMAFVDFTAMCGSITETPKSVRRGKVGWTHGAGAHVRATQRGDVGAPAVFHSI
jgi:hypothetical protein